MGNEKLVLVYKMLVTSVFEFQQNKRGKPNVKLVKFCMSFHLLLQRLVLPLTEGIALERVSIACDRGLNF